MRPLLIVGLVLAVLGIVLLLVPALGNQYVLWLFGIALLCVIASIFTGR